jgi:hypothetical protein
VRNVALSVAKFVTAARSFGEDFCLQVRKRHTISNHKLVGNDADERRQTIGNGARAA